MRGDRRCPLELTGCDRWNPSRHESGCESCRPGMTHSASAPASLLDTSIADCCPFQCDRSTVVGRRMSVRCRALPYRHGRTNHLTEFRRSISHPSSLGHAVAEHIYTLRPPDHPVDVAQLNRTALAHHHRSGFWSTVVRSRRIRTLSPASQYGSQPVHRADHRAPVIRHRLCVPGIRDDGQAEHEADPRCEPVRVLPSAIRDCGLLHPTAGYPARVAA